MPTGLVRFHQSRQTHFITFSCFRRQPFLVTPAIRNQFLVSLEQTRVNYELRIFGYVVMPEHVHLLLSEPIRSTLAVVVQALKVSVAKLSGRNGGAFWQKRYYDHNVRNHAKFVEKLRYLHRNPAARGLCDKPEDWLWSSFRHYATGEVGPVEIESEWTARLRAPAPRVIPP